MDKMGDRDIREIKNPGQADWDEFLQRFCLLDRKLKQMEVEFEWLIGESPYVDREEIRKVMFATQKDYPDIQ